MVLLQNAPEMGVQLAFSITTHGNLGILEAQLASLFHPENAYCIYIDAKAPEGFLCLNLVATVVKKMRFHSGARAKILNFPHF